MPFEICFDLVQLGGHPHEQIHSIGKGALIEVIDRTKNAGCVSQESDQCGDLGELDDEGFFYVIGPGTVSKLRESKRFPCRY